MKETDRKKAKEQSEVSYVGVLLSISNGMSKYRQSVLNNHRISEDIFQNYLNKQFINET